jgi:CheY-like chemotaxis protein
VAPLQILLVEDHADTRRCLHRLLESRGHQVLVAEDAQSAIELSEREKFDLLIADVGLPDRSGLELLHELREREPELSAIALSGYGTPQNIMNSKEAGFIEHLVKPVDLQKLHAVIDSLATVKTGRR